MEHAPEGILAFDADASRFIDANKNALLIPGYPKDQIMRMSWIDVSVSTQLGRFLPALGYVHDRTLSGPYSRAE